ncbi:hypothetical protein [uncultured Roseateles sp.]|uniref:hypothetical protein n=1 Tax=Roseateles sp. 22389 TaxID=3453916 RepID=UPI00263685ED|nr:hypothetical protein [uncultured Roseateles sp.]
MITKEIGPSNKMLNFSRQYLCPALEERFWMVANQIQKGQTLRKLSLNICVKLHDGSSLFPSFEECGR